MTSLNPNHTPARILGDGINQLIMFGGPGESVARLRGALAFCELSRGESGEEKQPTPSPVFERIPLAAVAVGETE